MHLLEFLEVKPELANDKLIGVDGAHFRDREWSLLAEELNSMGGAIKDGQKWRKCWKDLTISVRSKNTDIKEKRMKSGVNGPVPIKDLSEIERRIISIITLEAVEGVSQNVNEVGFEETQPPCEDEVDDIIELMLDDIPTTSTHQAAEPMTPQSTYQPPTNYSTLPQRRVQTRRMTIANSSDATLKMYNEIELKKIKLEEQKIKLKEKDIYLKERKIEILTEQNENQKELINKIKELIEEIKSK